VRASVRASNAQEQGSESSHSLLSRFPGSLVRAHRFFAEMLRPVEAPLQRRRLLRPDAGASVGSAPAHDPSQPDALPLPGRHQQPHRVARDDVALVRRGQAPRRDDAGRSGHGDPRQGPASSRHAGALAPQRLVRDGQDREWDASAVVVVEEEVDPEDTLAMQEWFAMFRILDRLKSHVGRAGAVPVALRIDEVRDELNSILEGGELSLSTLRGCRDSLAGIEDEFVHVQPAVASPHPKHKLSIQNKETRLLQSLGVILSTLRSLTDPIVRSRATPPLRTNSTNGRRTV
jgi:hypothetical protein